MRARSAVRRRPGAAAQPASWPDPERRRCPPRTSPPASARREPPRTGRAARARRAARIATAGWASDGSKALLKATARRKRSFALRATWVHELTGGPRALRLADRHSDRQAVDRRLVRARPGEADLAAASERHVNVEVAARVRECNLAQLAEAA